MKFKTGEKENKQKLHFDASKTIFLEKFNKIDLILFKFHFVYQEKIALPRACMNRERFDLGRTKTKTKTNKPFLHELFNSYYLSLTD